MTRLCVALLFLTLAALPVPAPAGSDGFAPADSTAIATFLDLPADELQQRRSAAAERARMAEDSTNGPRRRAAWQEAARLDPAAINYWLALVETEMEMGYLDEAASSLAAARASLDFLEGEARREAIRDYAVQVSWWDFEMGRFEKGSAWGDRAVEYGAGLEGYLPANLCHARMTGDWNDLRKHITVFRPLDSGGNRRANYSWCLVNFAMENNFPPFNAEHAAWWLHRSKGRYEHDVSRWRDYGHYCEMHDTAHLAVSYYERSIEMHPFAEGGWIRRAEFQAPIAVAPNATMPFWVNPDGGFVTGSLIAWCGFVHAEMRSIRSADERMQLAARLETGTARSVERFPQSPWLRLWRAEALSELGRSTEAVQEAALARANLSSRGIRDPEVDRIEGRVLLGAGRFADAMAPLQRATGAFPSDADCWTDLAIAELRTGDASQARTHLDHALELDGSQPVALYERGLLRWRDGDRDRALADIQRAADQAPDRTDFAEMLERLASASGDSLR